MARNTSDKWWRDNQSKLEKQEEPGVVLEQFWRAARNTIHQVEPNEFTARAVDRPVVEGTL